MLLRRLAITLALTLLTAACAAPVAAAPASSSAAAAKSDSDLGEQTSEAAAVAIVVSWLGADVPSARVVMDTHSVDLDGFDLKELARLRLDGGTWVAPSLWDAPKGGHHRTGMLTFASLSRANFDAAKVVELEVRDVALPSRLLRWERAR